MSRPPWRRPSRRRAARRPSQDPARRQCWQRWQWHTLFLSSVARPFQRCQTFPALPDLSSVARHFQRCQTFPALPEFGRGGPAICSRTWRWHASAGGHRSRSCRTGLRTQRLGPFRTSTLDIPCWTLDIPLSHWVFSRWGTASASNRKTKCRVSNKECPMQKCGVTTLVRASGNGRRSGRTCARTRRTGLAPATLASQNVE
jgi:hypothetical protein